VNIRHVLKSGTTVNSIKGHKVKRTDAEAIYELAESMNQRKGSKGEKNNHRNVHSRHHSNGVA